jgi:hypothetical protein
MRFMVLIKSEENKFGPPPPALLQAIGEMGNDAQKAGVLVETGGLLGSDRGAQLALRGGKITVTDGPFTEAKEIVGGYAVYELSSKEEAIEWSRRFLQIHITHWPQFEGEVEIRQIMTFAPPM